MAIIVEEERKRGSPARAVLWMTVLIILGIAAYYIFLARPQTIEIVAPPGFGTLEPLAEAQVNPESIVNSADFQSLKQYVSLPEPGNAGRINPFIPPP